MKKNQEDELFIVVVQKLAQYKKNHYDELQVVAVVLEVAFVVATKKIRHLLSWFWKQMEREKNHDDELGVHHGGFGCYNTRKKNQDDKHSTCIKLFLEVLVLEVFALKKTKTMSCNSSSQLRNLRNATKIMMTS